MYVVLTKKTSDLFECPCRLWFGMSACMYVWNDKQTSLAKAPHPHVMGAISIDDRIEASGMPILLPRADGHFGQVLQHANWWSVSGKLRCAVSVRKTK